jgi:uncharacterized protein YjbI with pentapeptide repeats
MKNKPESPLSRRWQQFASYIGWEDAIAVTLILLGILGYFEGSLPYVPHLTDFYLDIRSELIGIGITVLIIDNVNEMYRRRAEKERLILQLGSPDNGFALEAARQLSARKWLYDGSLRAAKLHEANLTDAVLTSAKMDLADLSQARLTSALLAHASLVGASLIGADLSLAGLRDANVAKADLQSANLSMATMVGAIFAEANLAHANLSGAYLRQGNLTGACLDGANLTGANLEQADLRDARFSSANLSGCDLTDARLARANFRRGLDPNFPHDADLRDARLSGADLTGSSISDDQLASAKTLVNAIMPDGKRYDPAIHTEIERLRKE